MKIPMLAASVLATLWLARPATALEPLKDQAELNVCPPFITEAGPDPSNWTLFSNLDEVLACNHKPRLLDFTIHYPLRASGPGNAVRACTSFQGELLNLTEVESSSAAAVTTKNKHELQISWDDTDESVITPQAITAVKELQSFLLTEIAANKSSIFVHYGDTAVGIYLGEGILPAKIATDVVEPMIEHIWNSSMPRRLAVELCNSELNSDYTIGIMVDTTPGPASLINVQSAVRSWSNATCLDGLEHTKPFGTLDVEVTNPPSSNSSASTLSKRADCSTIQVKGGDSCAALATRCGIKAADFTKYNSQTKDLCSTLREGQHVCCSSGDLPDFSPKPDPDGGCATYQVQSGDYCDKIAAANSLEVKDLEAFNKNTWGWSGCKRLFAEAIICLSKGDPPMPSPIANAVCGPQKPDTKKPSNGEDLSDLNPCPLNACCNIWGQCGITEDFCKNTTLGPPGTAEEGTNGCISNCGTDIVNNKSPPSSFMRVGYFEAWNNERPCLWMDASELESMTELTHVHFSFAKLTESFEVDVSEVSYQFNKFKKLKGPKRILAFGGWVDSTHPTKYHILRNAVKQQNRLKVAKNIAAFIKQHDLDGVDIDWEYPGAPDIPDIPPADETDGSNYLGMLTLLKAQLSGKSLSIAAPASFWYLKPYPIEKMAKVVDYIIYMTYDLHGQWDYDNKWASPGCPKGDCLRSHVNLTETLGALSMITKAGVPSTKVIVGVTSYGRSFKMAKAGCTGPMCEFLGSSTESLAKKGICTGTSGYISNAEIDDLIDRSAKSVKKWVDDSDSDILVYDDTEWVAYMSDSTKRKRISKYQGLNFGGVTDWAVDLQKFGRSEGGSFIEIIEEDPECKWMTKDGFDCLDEAVRNASMQADERWNKMRAPCAWRDVVKNWLKERDGQDIDVDKYPNDFSRSMSMLLDGPESFNCATLPSSANGCKQVKECFITEDAGPVSYFIINSFAAIHTLFNSLRTAISDAENTIQSDLGTLVDLFAPDVDDSAEFNLIADMVGVALGMLSAPAFNKMIRHGAKGDDLKDLIANSASWGATIAKDVQNSQRETDASKVAGKLGDLSKMWKNATTEFMKQAFKGDDKSVDYIGQMIAQGKFNNPRVTIEVPELEFQIRRVLYAILIPEAWRVGAGLAPAFIMDSGYDCNAVGPLDNDYISPSTAEEMGYCHKGRRYYILAPNGDATNCGHQSPPANGDGPPCNDRYFSAPQGIAELTGKSDAWEGITKEDLIVGAVEGWKLRGEKNRGGFPDMTNPENYDFLLDNNAQEIDIRTPGIVQIPVCTPEKARGGWKYGSSLSSTQKETLLDVLPYYPCPNY
ncbi:hypothetical protein CEP51_008443 [Fusarium floridanum]|uniref:chitinase n=1 Tax=Fusarium floridanum TaxID=1325733 RepID=A0A428RKY5_9HYPO|nr:hypothetical protein CEP51_008443 [Fusarium floridanum]